MDKLPKWRFPRTQPAFHDWESATALEAIHMLYGVMNELVEEWNKFDSDLNERYEAFTQGANKDYASFTSAVLADLQGFTDAINAKIQTQDQLIQDTINYFNENIQGAVVEILDQQFADGNIQLTMHYDEASEGLSIVGANVDELDVMYDPEGESLNHV